MYIINYYKHIIDQNHKLNFNNIINIEQHKLPTLVNP